MLDTIIAAVLLKFIDILFGWAQEKNNARKGIYIDTKLERGPTSREHGFTETAVKVTLMNETGQRLTIQDIRLMFCGTHGLPVLPQAPVPRSHPTLPAPIDSGSAATWYFGVETVAQFFQTVSDPASKTQQVRVRPKFTTVTRKTFTDRTIRLSTDVDAYF